MTFVGWDFMRQFTTGMAIVVASVVIAGLFAVLGLHEVSASNDRLAGIYAASALSATELEGLLERRSGFAREYLLTADRHALRREDDEAAEFERKLPELRAQARNVEGRALLDRIDAAELRYSAALTELTAKRARNDAEVGSTFERAVVPAKDELANLLAAYGALKEQQFVDAEATSSLRASRVAVLVGIAAGLALFIAVALAVLLWRGARELTRGRELIAASHAQLERSNLDLDAFAGRVAHDLRGALGPVLLAPQTLRAAKLSEERIQWVVQRIDRAVERAVGIIDALLAFSRAGATVDATASADVRTAVAHVVEALETNLGQADAVIIAEIETAELRCPAGLLNVLLSNLVGNSIKFLQGRPLREIRLRGRVLRGGYELSVDDTGPGIPEDARERIFEPFFRVPGTSVNGTGIGLATVRRVVDAYGGRITVASKVGEGSSFSVWLPLAMSRESERPTHVDAPTLN